MIQNQNSRGCLSLAFIFALILGVFSSTCSFADYAAAMRLRQKIEWTLKDELPAHISAGVISKKLRTTKGFDQGHSQFCWVFSTLNVLETNYLEQHPEATPGEVELSRWYFQEATGSQDTRGTAVDALYHYSQKIGLISYNDYTPKLIPNFTRFRGQEMSPGALRQLILDGQTYWSYAFSKSISGWYQHPDSDALPGTLAFYVDPSKKREILNKAIRMGKAVSISSHGHGVMVYGADFDSDGDATKYYIKDSYPGYFYAALPNELDSNVYQMTTIANLQ